MIRIFKSLGTALAVLLVALPLLAAEAKVDINRAAVEELVKLPRVGPAVAQRIVEFRKENGPFRKPEDLLLVRGVGQKTFDLLKERITVGETAAAAAPAK